MKHKQHEDGDKDENDDNEQKWNDKHDENMTIINMQKLWYADKHVQDEHDGHKEIMTMMKTDEMIKNMI